jgi:CHAT domain-containing protein
MKRRFNLWPYIAVVVLIMATVAVIFAQPSSLPLSAEFRKRREAGSAFQLGRIYLKQGKPDSYGKAIGNFENAAKLYGELGDRANVGCSLLGIGAVQALQGKNNLAAQTYQEAIAIFRILEGRDINENSLAKLGFLYDELVDKRFLFNYDELSIQPPNRGYDQNGDRVDTRLSRLSERYYVQFFNQLFTVYYREQPESILDDSRMAGSSRQPKPVSFYDDVLAIWKLNGVENIEVATRLNLMEAWADENPQVAVFFGKQAINQYQQIRKLLRSTRPYDPRLYVNRLTDKYRVLADLLISLGRLAEADEVLQMLKEEEFSEFVRRDAAEIERLKRQARLTPKERQLVERYLTLADRASEIGEQYRGLDDKKQAGKPLSDAEEKRHRQLAAQTADLNAAFKLFLEKELVNEIGTENAKTLAADRTLQDRVRELGPGTVSLYTVITENRYRIVMTTPTVQIDAKTEISAANLNKKIFAFRQALQDTKVDPRPLGKELYDILVKPIEKDLAAAGAKTLVWSLDGTLRYIPMAALSPDGKTYLVERYQNVTVTPRTRNHLTTQNTDWKALGMGLSEEQNVTYPDQPGQKVKVDALPGTKQELISIIRDESDPTETGILEGKRFLDANFTMKNLTDSLGRKNTEGKRRFTIVHLASHFRLGNNWSNSFLFLGNGKLLSLEELSGSPQIDFSDIELVTLSACNTALATASNGIEVDSLAEAIQAKSGKAVLATLWAVYDESTAALMSSFYRTKNDGSKMTKGEALQRAQVKMLEEKTFAHPYYWSGFTLIGNWR